MNEPNGIEVQPTGEPAGLGEWLGLWAAGKVQSQLGAFLDKIVRDRVNAKATKRGPDVRGPGMGSIEVAKIQQRAHELLVDTFTSGAPDVPESLAPHIEKLRAFAAEQIDGGIEMSVQASIGRGAGDDAYIIGLEEKIRELDAKTERLTAECRRAHDWRFRLEVQSRSAEETVRYMLDTARRAPTKEEMEGVASTLREGIGWTP